MFPMTKYADWAAREQLEGRVHRSHLQAIRSRKDRSGVNRAGKYRAELSRLRCYLPALVAAGALLCSAATQAQSVANEPGTPIEITARDLESNGTGNNWFSFHGDYTGRRYSTLKEINRDNISQLQLKWVFHSRKTRVLGATPVVVGGVMYLTASNDLFAIDGRTGAVLWHHTRQDAAGTKDDESAHVNRGVAVLNHSIYMETDDAHLLSLDARSGNVLWDVPYAGPYVGQGGVSAPLAVRDKVIVGTSNGKDGRGGVVIAFDAASGKEIWRFGMQAPSRQRDSPDSSAEPHGYHGEDSMPGTYDPELDMIYWEIGGESCGSGAGAQPAELKHDGCLLALDSSTGKLKWQSSLPDRELLSPAVSEVPVLVNTTYQGASRKLIILANGSGFLEILDRESGRLLGRWNAGSPKSAPGASEPQNSDATKGHTTHGDAESGCPIDKLLPSWNPPSFGEATHNFYFISLKACTSKTAEDGARQPAPRAKGASETTGESALLAYDPASDRLAWKQDSAITDHAPTGVLTTASGLILLGGNSQSFQAADAATGKVLWSFSMGQSAAGSPMSYAIGGNQYFAIAAGNDLFVFALP
jgi:alcohol dehydrogenase (cytochrome c)